MFGDIGLVSRIGRAGTEDAASHPADDLGLFIKRAMLKIVGKVPGEPARFGRLNVSWNLSADSPKPPKTRGEIATVEPVSDFDSGQGVQAPAGQGLLGPSPPVRQGLPIRSGSLRYDRPMEAMSGVAVPAHLQIESPVKFEGVSVNGPQRRRVKLDRMRRTAASAWNGGGSRKGDWHRITESTAKVRRSETSGDHLATNRPQEFFGAGVRSPYSHQPTSVLHLRRA